jgi:hypothetical protein
MIKQFWRIINCTILLAVCYFGVAFTLGKSDGSFAGRNALEWTKVTVIRSSIPGVKLERKICTDAECQPELRLLLNRDLWYALEKACLTAAPDTCFDGPRIDFRMSLQNQRNAPVTIVALWRDGRREFLKTAE